MIKTRCCSKEAAPLIPRWKNLRPAISIRGRTISTASANGIKRFSVSQTQRQRLEGGGSG